MKDHGNGHSRDCYSHHGRAHINKPDVKVNQIGAKQVAAFFRQLVKFLDEDPQDEAPNRDSRIVSSSPRKSTKQRN
jgi:hypothetical protein